MQNRTVPLSLIISAALSIPSLAMAVSADIESGTAMDMDAVPTQDMMQNQAENPNVEPFSTQAEVAPRDPEMQAYDEPYNNQSNDDAHGHNHDWFNQSDKFCDGCVGFLIKIIRNLN